MIITAEGDTTVFDKVENLVDAAPLLEYWTVCAFKPVKEDFFITYKGLQLDPKKLSFIPLNKENSTQIGLRVYLEQYDNEDQENYLKATFLVLDNLLGEKSHALDIGYVELDRLPANMQAREELIELIKLPRYIKWKRAQQDG